MKTDSIMALVYFGLWILSFVVSQTAYGIAIPIGFMAMNKIETGSVIG